MSPVDGNEPADRAPGSSNAPAPPPAEPRVQIHYKRILKDERIYDQRVVLEREDVIITLSEPLDLTEPMTAPDGRLMLEGGSLALWFTFPGVWHDIARFHDAEGAFTGLYANILTPVEIEGSRWDTTDLLLDVWWPVGGEVELLDEDELEEAERLGAITPELAARARQEAERVLGLARRGAWPPEVVEVWGLQRATDPSGSERPSGG